MNRNVESHFAINPTNLDIGRSRFKSPTNRTFSGNVGFLIPFYWTEILPGDTLTLDDSKVVRTSTFIDPVMDNLYLDTYYFFVPMRLVWSHTREFFGENTQGAWYPSTSYTVPQLSFSTDGAGPGTVSDYLGVPPGVKDLRVSALPFRSYTKIFMDWFIDQNTMTPPVLNVGDSTDYYHYNTPAKGGIPYKACKYHDFFTSALPNAQRGPAVTVPLSGTIPVSLSGSVGKVVTTTDMHDMGTSYVKLASDGDSDANAVLGRTGYINGLSTVQTGAPAAGRDQYPILKSNLVVNWPSEATLDLSGASPISVNDLRLAFQMQKWYERSALFGGRYIEMLKSQFGVTSPDARLQRSEYLGGNRIPINVHQVEATTASSNQPLGTLGAYGHTSDSNHAFTHSFTEHGIVMGICVARYPHKYPQGLQKAFLRKTMFDFYFPVFANIGNQPIPEACIYAQGTSDDDNVFGYSEAWAEYRYQPDLVMAQFRPHINGSLKSWTYADDYSSAPVLSEGWIQETSVNVDRTLAVTSATSHQLLFDFALDCTWVRAMPLYSIPGLIDHH